MLVCGTQEKILPIFTKKWKPGKKCDRTTMLTLRRPTPVSKFRDSLPRPQSRPVKHALPLWEHRELNEKIPMFHGYGPAGRIVLHRGLMGNHPLKTNVKIDFSLTDPYCHDISNMYEPLHDPHLKPWMDSGNKFEYFYRQGLVTEDRDVICKLREYNEYRRFLWRIHNDAMMKQWKLKEERELEQKKIFNANLNHKKDLTKKLKMLKIIMSENEPHNLSNNKNKFKTKCKTPKTTLKKPKFKPKKIETYTEFGLGKGCVIDQKNYRGTFIKGSPNEFYLLGFFDDLFQKQNKFITIKKKKTLNL